MKRLPLRERGLAFLLAMLAGYTDAIGFMQSGGFFLSFMSGNTTRLGVGMWESAAHVGLAAALVASFAGGVIGGTLLGRLHPQYRQARVMTLVSVALSLACGLFLLGHQLSALLLTSAAMGVENTLFERDGEITVGLTYMTGAIVKFGQRLAHAIAGPWQSDWVLHLALWLSLMAGAIAGALAFREWGFTALTGSAVLAILVAVWLWGQRPTTQTG